MEPPDPGGTASPEVGQYVTIESSMDTDASVSSIKTSRKRIRPSRMCKHCNKKRRKHGRINKEHDCACSQADAIVEPSTQSAPQIVPTPPQQTDTSKTPYTYNPVGRSTYNKTDAAPFIVHIQKITESDSSNSILHPVSFGRVLKQNNVKNIINGSLKKIGRNKVSVSFSEFEDANLFMENLALKEKYKVFIPTFNVTRMGVIKGVPLDWTEEDIIKDMSTPIGCGKIIKVRRMKRKVFNDGKASHINTGTVVATFDGQVLPKRIFMCYSSLSVELYIFPTVQCFNCCRFGHVKDQCRSLPRCFKCGGKHSGSTCSAEEGDFQCCSCGGSHFATNKKCPEFERQRAIKLSMAQSCISYAEASKIHPQVTRLFSEVVSSKPISTPFMATNNDLSFVNNPSSSTSYKKTVYLKPKSPPTIAKGYDRKAHNEIIQEHVESSPNGGVIKHRENITISEQSTASTIEELIKMLTTYLTQCKYKNTPPNDDHTNMHQPSTNNGSPQSATNDSVELPKYKK